MAQEIIVADKPTLDAVNNTLSSLNTKIDAITNRVNKIPITSFSGGWREGIKGVGYGDVRLAQVTATFAYRNDYKVTQVLALNVTGRGRLLSCFFQNGTYQGIEVTVDGVNVGRDIQRQVPKVGVNGVNYYLIREPHFDNGSLPEWCYFNSNCIVYLISWFKTGATGTVSWYGGVTYQMAA